MTSPTTDAKISLTVQPRTISGKRVRMLRAQGIVPANISGHGFTPRAVQVAMRDFQAAYKEAGETTLVYVQSEGKAIPTLIGAIDYHPVTDEILHVEFRKVNLKQKIEANVPLEFIGESEAVKSKQGVLLTQIEEVVVEALPAEIPHAIEVDLSKLIEIGDAIRVGDLPKATAYIITDDPEGVIVSVTEHKEEEIEPETTAEAPEIISEKPSDEGENTEAKE